MKTRRALCFSACLALLGCASDPGSAGAPGGSDPSNNPGGRDGGVGNPGSDAGDGTEPGGAPPELPPGAGVGTLAGSSESGAADGVRTEARFNNPTNVLVAPDGRIIVADYDNGLIRALSPSGVVTTLVRQTNFARPFGLAMTPDGALYVQTDSDDEGGHSYTTGTLWRVGNDGTASPLVRDLGRPRGLAALPDGRVAMADPEHHSIRVYNPMTLQVIDLAGVEDQAGYLDGMGHAARFNRPYDLVVAGDRILVADQNNHRIRAVALDGAVSTFAGSGTMGTADGLALQARFNRPQGLARDAAGNVYVTEMGGYVVRRIAPDGTVGTIAGSGRSGYRDGDALQARFFGLEGIDVTPDGAFVYVSDGNRGGSDDSHRVRRIATGLGGGGNPGE